MAKTKYKLDEEDYEADARKTVIDGFDVERRDPYGFWWIVDPPHKVLVGSFTNLDEVRKATARYAKLLEDTAPTKGK